jgi:hypothetical protein
MQPSNGECQPSDDGLPLREDYVANASAKSQNRGQRCPKIYHLAWLVEEDGEI